VHYFDGREKWNRSVYCAVVDMEIGKRDLQQCADAVIRLQAEYLYKHKAYDRIHFNFTNGFRADYTKWAEGYRISVKGNQVSWYKSKEKDYSYKTFRAYLDVVFAYAGTLSLAKELTSVPVTSMQIGDVLIQGGSPGHAVIVVDMAENPATGEKLYLLAQSYMPAQDIQVLVNLKERCPALTGDDVFYCVLSLLCCSKTVMMELMDATSDALKTRKNRIKNKMDTQIFERVFGADNQ